MRCVCPRMKAALWGHNETQTATSSVSSVYCPGLRLNVQECGIYARNNCLVCVSLCIKNQVNEQLNTHSEALNSKKLFLF